RKARVMSDKYGGAVIFIDEIDAVGARGGVTTDRARAERATDRLIMGAGMGGGGMGMGVINELLVQMDGFTVPRGVWRPGPRAGFRGQAEGPFLHLLVDGGAHPRIAARPRARRAGRVRSKDPRRPAELRRT